MQSAMATNVCMLPHPNKKFVLLSLLWNCMHSLWKIANEMAPFVRMNNCAEAIGKSDTQTYGSRSEHIKIDFGLVHMAIGVSVCVCAYI